MHFFIQEERLNQINKKWKPINSMRNLNILKRFPAQKDFVPVLAVGVTILFSWAIISSAQDVITNWSLYFNVVDILSLYAYILVSALIESCILISALLIISLILPPKLFLDRFLLRGTILTVTFLGSIMYLYSQTLTSGILERITTWFWFFMITTLIFLVLGESIQVIARFFELIADRCMIFLYIYLPASLISIFILILRNMA